jgi:hypothetical protein
VHLDRVARSLGRILGPELVDEALDRDGFVGVQQKVDEDSTLLGRAELDGSAPDARLERSEYAKFDGWLAG